MAHPASYPSNAAQILRFVKEEHISLAKVAGDGYIIIVYDDEKRELYESVSVMVPRYNSLTFGEWKKEIEKLKEMVL